MSVYEIDENTTIEKLCQELKPQTVIKVRSCGKTCKGSNCGTYVYIEKVDSRSKPGLGSTSRSATFGIQGVVMDKSPIDQEHLIFTQTKCKLRGDDQKIFFEQETNRHFSVGNSVRFIDIISCIVDTIKILAPPPSEHVKTP